MNRDEFQKVVGENIRKYRKQERYSLQGLADVVGVSRNAISNWENGKDCITLYNLYRVAYVLGVEVTQLVPLHHIEKRQIVVSDGNMVTDMHYGYQYETTNKGT